MSAHGLYGLTDQEKRFMETTESNLEYFNRNRKKGKIEVNYYVDGGNKADVIKDGCVILSCVTIENAYWTVAGIINYERR